MKTFIILNLLIFIIVNINCAFGAVTNNPKNNLIEITTIGSLPLNHPDDIEVDVIDVDVNEKAIDENENDDEIDVHHHTHINYVSSDQIRKEKMMIKNKGLPNEEITVKGQYFLLGDGNKNRQFVHFVADKNGYRALVNYSIKYDGGYKKNALI